MKSQRASKSLPSPARGQAWKWTRLNYGIFYVMAVADGYVLARYKGCKPFVKTVKELQSDGTRMDAFDRKMRNPT